MPAIHQFQGHHWGWHCMDELLEVVNGLLSLRDESPMTREQVVQKFKALTIDADLPMVLVDCWRGEKGWADFCHDFNHENAYVPAGWGIAVIDAVKKRFRRVGLLFTGHKYERFGVKSDGTRVSIKYQGQPMFVAA